MDQPEATYDLTSAEAIARERAAQWGLKLGERFAMAHVSFVAPADDAVIKVPWLGDDESLNEADALELWNGDGAVRLLRRCGRTLLEDRATPGIDVSAMPEGQATEIVVEIASRLWRRAGAPFRPVSREIPRWLYRAEGEGSSLVPLARELLADLDPQADWLVHGDFHHHNILRHGDHFVAIDPKPYLSEREYDVPTFLWNPRYNRLDDRRQTERRIAAFVSVGLDDFRIRAWTVIRGAYLRPRYAERLEDLLRPRAPTRSSGRSRRQLP